MGKNKKAKKKKKKNHSKNHLKSLLIQVNFLFSQESTSSKT